ncbi:MAG TPA: hypothetical protein VG871_04390, partial [Vicinamibacterales bacterium]|nr:hypothetical protein [Vicinamibacterales bacterium]
PAKVAPQNEITNIPASMGGGDYTYDTLQFAFTKRFQKALFLNASLDLQRRSDRRSPSTSNDPLNADPIGIGAYLNPYPNVSNRQKTSTWATHVQARYVFRYDIGLAVNYTGQSGWPYARVITVTLPNAGSTSFFADNLSSNRSDNIHLLALRVDKSIPVRPVKVTVMFDLFNVLNSNAVTNFNLLNGTNFNRINATVDPKTAQVALRVEF